MGEANSANWDAGAMAQFIAASRPIAKVWFRPEVRGLDTFPPGGALVVSNHSGGLLTTDTLIFSMAFYDRFGFNRPVHTLGHSALFVGPVGDLLRKTGLIHADADTTTAALQDGAVVMVFPGGCTTPSAPPPSETRSTSMDAPAMSRQPWLREFRLFLSCRSAARRTSCSSPAERGWRADSVSAGCGPTFCR